MASEKVRLASKALGPLVRRRGTSPALKVTLRQAVKTLARALAETDTKTQEGTIRQAIDELRFGLQLIQNSQRPADHAQLEGTAEALSFLAPLEGAMAPEPVCILAPAPPPAAGEPPSPPAHPNPLMALPAPAIVPRPAPAKAEAKARLCKPLSLDFPTVHLRLVGLTKTFKTLHLALTEPLTILRDLEVACAELDKIVQAVKWLGVKCVPAFLKACENAETVEDRLVASAALIHLGALGAVERMMSMLEGAVAEKQPLPPIAGTILRTLTDATVLNGMLKLLLKPGGDAFGSLLLPLLAEQGVLSSEQLLKLANHPSDAIAVPAVEALAWFGDAHNAPLLLASAPKATTPGRADALLFAAVALGSVEAIAEVRAQLPERAASSHHLVEALALAGDDSDAPRLIALAERPGIDADHFLLAAANLGCIATVQALPAPVGHVRRETLEQARRMILGSGFTHPSGEGSAIRRLHGEPWSVSGLLSRLAAPDEPVQSQRRLALEIRVRTGLVPPTKFPLLMSAAARAELVASWRAHFAKARGQLAPGGWYYQGKPAGKENGAW
jgi:hypothetical protein